MLGPRWGSLAVVALLGCGQELVPVPDVEPFSSSLPEIRLGVRVADLRELRPGFEISGDGTYRESFDRYDVVYHFWPKEPGRPPPLTARLVALESREDLFDSLRLWPEWRRVFAALEQESGAEPDCVVLGDSRATISRAFFVGSGRVSLAAEIWRAPDGQRHEAFLVTRVGIEPMESAEEATLDRRRVACSELVGTGPAPSEDHAVHAHEVASVFITATASAGSPFARDWTLAKALGSAGRRVGYARRCP